jgi:hypothetical protein
MKTRILLLATVVFSSSLFFTSCKKEKDSTPETDYTTETTVHSDDQSRFSSEIDAVANDADLALEVTSGFAGRMSTETLNIICDADIVIDTLSSPRTITITYNGTNCLGNRTRTGVIVISMESGIRWKNAGAVLNVSFQNFKVTRVSDNKSITINGTQSYTNVSGGLLINLPTSGTITHRITSSNMSVTFDDLSQRNWQVGRQRVFSYDNGVNITTTGTHTDGNVTGITEWGNNRFGNGFTTVIAEPLIVRQSCNFRLVSGKVQHKTTLYNAAVTFGLDVNGNATSCPGAGAYYMKIVWTGPLGIPHTAIHPY